MPSGDTERELRQVAESLVLAERMFRKGRIAEAEPMYERSLAMLLRTYAEAHPDIDACLLRLGDIYFAREKFAQALSTYSRLHGLRSRMLSVHHADTIAISFKIAKSQEQLERFDEAARTYEEAISLGEQWLPAGFPLIGSMMESYAILLRKYMNQPRVASEVDQRAKEYRKKYTGKKTVQQAWQIKATPTPTLAPALAPTPPQAQAPTPLQAP
ncbi:MAG: tetratricopeptide repeat protein, partial [Cyanobacteria bacterium SZAS LIN-5]|nr:tetratricopeptide repeat protein [Cyanobacteria bacterium SZAS LIN-5]